MVGPSPGHPAGARHCRSASSGGLLASQEAAIYRLPVMASAASEHNQTIGGTITAGAIKALRSKPDSGGTIGVSTGPPGSTTFTVTPLPLNSSACPDDMASRAALHGP